MSLITVWYITPILHSHALLLAARRTHVEGAVINSRPFLCRNACYGSAEVSFPAVLPYLAQMPKELLGPDPSVISQLLASIWHGWEVAGTQGTARAAAAESYVECMIWTFAKSPDVSGLQAQHPSLPVALKVFYRRLTRAQNSPADMM